MIEKISKCLILLMIFGTAIWFCYNVIESVKNFFPVDIPFWTYFLIGLFSIPLEVVLAITAFIAGVIALDLLESILEKQAPLSCVLASIVTVLLVIISGVALGSVFAILLIIDI